MAVNKKSFTITSDISRQVLNRDFPKSRAASIEVCVRAHTRGRHDIQCVITCRSCDPLQHYINSLVAGEASVLGSKETQLLVSLIATLSTKLDPSQLVSRPPATSINFSTYHIDNCPGIQVYH